MVDKLCELLAKVSEGEREVVQYDAMSIMLMRKAVRLLAAKKKANKMQREDRRAS